VTATWDDVFSTDPVEIEVKARRGFGKLGRLGRPGGGKWDENLHPRDRLGRFIETGSTVKLRGGAEAEVIGRAKGDLITVRRKDDGKVYNVDKGQLTVTKRPGGGAPTDQPGDGVGEMRSDPANDLVGDTPDQLDAAQAARAQNASATASARPVQPAPAPAARR
jgi:hypothetical protein